MMNRQLFLFPLTIILLAVMCCQGQKDQQKAQTDEASSSARDLLKRIEEVESKLTAPIMIEGAEQVFHSLTKHMEFYKVPGVSIASINNGKIEPFEFLRPVEDDVYPGGVLALAFVRDHDEPCAIGSDVIITAPYHATVELSFEQELRFADTEFGFFGEGNRHHSVAADIAVVQHSSIRAPHRLHSTIRRDGDEVSGTGVRPDINFLPARFIGDIGDPASIGGEYGLDLIES